MKEIRAIVRPSRLERLREALRAIPGFPGVTLFKVEGFTAPAAVDKRSVREELTDYSDKRMLCILADDAMVEPIRQAILAACATGQMGDGLVWIVDAHAVQRIRDGSAIG